jgi:hypothetical protein
MNGLLGCVDVKVFCCVALLDTLMCKVFAG